jgi:hypothetical protein
MATWQLAAGDHATVGALEFVPADKRTHPPLIRGSAFNPLEFSGTFTQGRIVPERFREMTTSPWVETIRAFGRGATVRPPFLHPTPAMLREVALNRLSIGWFGLPGLIAAPIQFTRLLNAGQTRDARDMAEDVARAGARMMTSPLIVEYERGVVVALVGVKMLGAYAESVRDLELLRRTTLMSRVGSDVYRRRWGERGSEPPREVQARVLWASTGDLGGEEDMQAALLDYRLHPYERWDMVRGFATSFCTNARELLFGIDPKRFDYLAFLDDRVSPRSRTREWIGFQRERLTGWMNDPAKQLQHENREAAGESSVLDVLRWVGLRDMQARMKYCAALRVRA